MTQKVGAPEIVELTEEELDSLPVSTTVPSVKRIRVLLKALYTLMFGCVTPLKLGSLHFTN